MRPLILGLIIFACTSSSLLVLASDTGPADPAAPSAPSAQTLPDLYPLTREINAARARRKLPPLAEDARLIAGSAWWAAWMASQGKLSHDDFAVRISAVAEGRPAGEVVAFGQEGPRAAVRAWMNSRGHKAHILAPYTAMGGASAPDKGGRLYFCVQFLK